jgi:hypothetical protein
VTLTRPSAGRTLDPVSGLYTSVESGKRRNFGPHQGLLVESGGRINHALHSAENIDANRNWSALQAETFVSSIIDGGTGVKVAHDGSSGWVRSSYIDGGGTTSGGKETLSIIIEESSQNRDGIFVKDDDTGELYIDARIDWRQSPPVAKNNNNASDAVNLRKLSDSGPNGGRVYRLIARGTAPNAGNNRQADIYLVGNGPPAGSESIIHHMQLEEDFCASLPIVTGSSSVLREKDEVEFSLGDWWNPSRGTFYVVFRRLSYTLPNIKPRILGNDPGNVILQRHFNNRLLFNVGGGGITQFGEILPYTTYKYALSWDGSGEVAVLNGGVSATNDGGNGFDFPGNVIKVGKRDNTLVEFEELRYIPEPLSESTLYTLTS